VTAQPNPIATEHLPFFITPPGQTDVLLNVVVVFVVLCVIGLGVIFFTIHSLPERIAHRTKKVQLDIVAVLCLLALFTNEHAFWFAALLLAFIDFPDLLTPVQRIVAAVERIARQDDAEGAEAAGESGSAASDPQSAVESASATSRAEQTQGQKGALHA
jgi:hypothetical protein